MACTSNPNGTPLLGKCCKPVVNCAPFTAFYTSRQHVTMTQVQTDDTGLVDFGFVNSCLKLVWVKATGETFTEEWDMCGHAIVRLTDPSPYVSRFQDDCRSGCVWADRGREVFDGMRPLSELTYPAAAYPNPFEPPVENLSPCGVVRQVFSAPTSPNINNRACVVAFAYRSDGRGSFFGRAGFIGTKMVVWLAGKWLTETWQFWEPDDANGSCGIRAITPRLLASEITEGHPLVLDANGVAVFPQPEEILTRVEVEAATHTAKYIYAIR